MAAQIWKVVGGGEKGGIMVRAGPDLTSLELPQRLATGAIVREVALQGERLFFERVSGSGPDTGWASIALKGKALLEKSDENARVSATDAAENSTWAEGNQVVEEEEPIEPTIEGLLKALMAERDKRQRLEQKVGKLNQELLTLKSRSNGSSGLWSLQNRKPNIHPSAYIAPGASIIGTVNVQKNASVWFNTTVRGDNEMITIGENSDVQDNSILHCDEGKPLEIGKNVLIGHQVCLHGCKIADNCLIGMRTTILDNAVIGENSFVAAGSVVPEGRVIPPNSFVQGNPAKRIELLQAMPDGLAVVQNAASTYVENKDRFKQHLMPYVF